MGRPGGNFREAVYLVDVVPDTQVGIVMQIAGQMADPAAAVHLYVVVGIDAAPAPLASDPQARLRVRVPAAVPDPFAAVVGQAIKGVPVAAPVSFNGFYRLNQRVGQSLIRIER